MSDQLMFVILSGLAGVYLGVCLGVWVQRKDEQERRRRYE